MTHDYGAPPRPPITTAELKNSEVYKAGFRGYNEGLTLKDNPFRKGTYQWPLWQDGWYDAKFQATKP